MERRRRRRTTAVKVRDHAVATVRSCAAWARRTWDTVRRRLRRWAPVVLVDASGRRARRLRRTLRRAARMHLRALGVTPPQHLLVVVQRRVTDGDRSVAALLQVYEAAGVRRHVLFLAFTVEDEHVSDGAIVSALRQQLHAVVADQLGTLVETVPAEPPARPAAVVPLRPAHPEPEWVTEEAPPPDDRWAPVEDGAYAVAQ